MNPVASNISTPLPLQDQSWHGTSQTNCVPETPHIIVELQQQSETIKTLLKRRTQSLASLTGTD